MIEISHFFVNFLADIVSRCQICILSSTNVLSSSPRKTFTWDVSNTSFFPHPLNSLIRLFNNQTRLLNSLQKDAFPEIHISISIEISMLMFVTAQMSFFSRVAQHLTKSILSISNASSCSRLILDLFKLAKLGQLIFSKFCFYYQANLKSISLNLLQIRSEIYKRFLSQTFFLHSYRLKIESKLPKSLI